MQAFLTPSSHLVQGLPLSLQPSTSDTFNLLVSRSPFIQYTSPSKLKTFRASPSLILSLTLNLLPIYSFLHLSMHITPRMLSKHLAYVSPSSSDPKFLFHTSVLVTSLFIPFTLHTQTDISDIEHHLNCFEGL